jgi:D-glycero-alpha-D-manno-heptose 1-phosphate guanylyltransferase
MQICIVLAGGLGLRLRSAVPDQPKCLAPLANRPFLAWLLQSLAVRGVDHFLLALGHGAEAVRESLSQPWAQGLRITCVHEAEPLGTGGAARFALIEAGVDEALVVNGDTWLEGKLDDMLRPLDLESAELMRVATVHTADRARYGSLLVDERQRVNAFLEKGQQGPGCVNAGLYRVHRKAFEACAEGTLSLETQLMPRLVALGALQARQLAGPFIDIGIPDDYRRCDARLRLREATLQSRLC